MSSAAPVGFGIGNRVANGQEGLGDVEGQPSSASAGLVCERLSILHGTRALSGTVMWTAIRCIGSIILQACVLSCKPPPGGRHHHTLRHARLSVTQGCAPNASWCSKMGTSEVLHVLVIWRCSSCTSHTAYQMPL